MIGRSIILQIVNLVFNFTPLTRGFFLRSTLLRLSGVDCALSARIIASARVVVTNVSIGEDTFIGHQVLITGDPETHIFIGSNVDIAPRVVIMSGSHHIDMRGAHSAGPGKGDKIVIQDGVWIGGNSTILPGVTIGKKAVIGAGSLVNRDIPPYSIAVGNPCRPIKLWNPKTGAFDDVKRLSDSKQHN